MTRVPPHMKLRKILLSETRDDLVRPTHTWAQTHKQPRLELAANLVLAGTHMSHAYWTTPQELRPYLVPDWPANASGCVHLLWIIEATHLAYDGAPPRVTSTLRQAMDPVWSIPANQWSWTNLAHHVEAACARASAGLANYTSITARVDVHQDLRRLAQ